MDGSLESFHHYLKHILVVGARSDIRDSLGGVSAPSQEVCKQKQVGHLERAISPSGSLRNKTERTLW